MPCANFAALDEDFARAGGLGRAHPWRGGVVCRHGTCTHRLPHKLGHVARKRRAVSRIWIWTAAAVADAPPDTDSLHCARRRQTAGVRARVHARVKVRTSQ